MGSVPRWEALFSWRGYILSRWCDKYISNIGELIPLDDGTIRPAIDTGCGVRDPSNVCRFISSLFYMHVSTTIKRSRSKPVLTITLGGVDSLLQVASWGAYLLERNVLTMSFAPRDARPKCNLLWKEEFLQFSVWCGKTHAIPSSIIWSRCPLLSLPHPLEQLWLSHLSDFS
jgi:hypothetical protein